MANGMAFDERPDLRVVKSHARIGTTWIAVAFAVIIVGGALALSRSFGKPHLTQSGKATAAWHPEPSFLLGHAIELQLNADQTRHVQVAARLWNLQKAAFEERFKTVGNDSTQAFRDLQSSKTVTGTYGQIVGDFENARARAWADASSTLTGDQALIVEDIRQGKPVSKVSPVAAIVQSPAAETAEQPIKNIDTEITRTKSRLRRESRKRHPDATRLDSLKNQLAYLTSRKAAQDGFIAEILPLNHGAQGPTYIPTIPLKVKPQPIPLAQLEQRTVQIAKKASSKK